MLVTSEAHGDLDVSPMFWRSQTPAIEQGHL